MLSRKVSDITPPQHCLARSATSRLPAFALLMASPSPGSWKWGSGDEIIVETRDAIYTYVLDEPPRQLTVKKTDTWVIAPVPGKPELKPDQPLITLTTCPDLFHSAKRSVGFGHLIRTERK